MAKIVIDHNQAKPVAPDLYGLFFEDINRSGDGGLYPEMLRNRAFEDSVVPKGCTAEEDAAWFRTKEGFREPFSHGEGDAKWAERNPYTPIPAWYADKAEMTLDLEDTLNDKREAALKVDFKAGGSIWNIGYHFIPATKDKPTLFYAFWKAEKPVTLTVSVVGGDGQVLASGKAEVPAGEYGRSDVRLVPTADNYESKLVISCEEDAKVTIGFTSYMPEETYMGHSLRTDLVELLKKTRSKFMRWPGGCVVEGLNKASAMRFVYSVGPVWERTSTWNLWHYRATNGFGYHEFLQLCEDLGMEALYVVNCGMTCQGRCPEFYWGDELDDMFEDCMMAMEYAMGDVTTKWGALRAKMGHPEPFKVKYIEIGNENDGPEYDKRYIIFYERLQKAYPEIVLISNAHTETRGLPTQYVDEHYYCDWQFFAQSGHLYDHYPRDGVKVFLGEYAVTRGEDVGTLHSALAETRFLMGLENNPEVVKLASFAPLFENVLYKQWNPNLISFDNHRSCGLPVLHALGMLGESRGTELLKTTNDAEMVQPIKYGFNGVIAYNAGLRMKQPLFNGEKAELCKEVLGHWLPEGDELVSDCTGNEHADSITRFPIQLTLANGIFTSKKQNQTEFTATVFMDEKTPKFALSFWGHNTTEPGIINMFPDPNAPEGAVQPKEVFALADTEYYTWTIENGTGRNDYLYRYQEHPITKPVELPIKYGEFNTFTVKTNGTGFDCYLNGELINHGEDRKYGRVETIVTMDDEYLFIKLLNNTDQDEGTEILFDIPVQDELEWSMISGDPKTMNSLDEPENIVAVCGKAAAANGKLVWNVPKWSFTILKLKKA